MSFPTPSLPFRFAALALAVALGGCSSLGELMSGDKVDYKSATVKTKPLEVPPDLTQLARDSRYATPGGVVSAAATPAQAAPTAPAAPSATPAVAITSQGNIRIERQGNQRWLVVQAAPEVVWPQVRAFWVERGFTIASENAEAGVMETDWAENRAKLPNDIIRNTIGRVLANLYDTGERDRFRTRIERVTGGSSEIYISHRGLEEVYTSERKDNTVWRARPSDPDLEAEFLSRLMARLGTKEEPAARAVVAAAPEAPARARALDGAVALEVDEPFDRAWRRIGLALDRTGFTVEDRDRTAGVYYVRYVDPKAGPQSEPGFFSRLFGGAQAPSGPARYRIAVKGSGPKTQVTVQNSTGAPEAGNAGQQIVALLVRELR